VGPMVDRQILPPLRSTAVRTPHGGGLQGVPSGDSATTRVGEGRPPLRAKIVMLRRPDGLGPRN
jgi:hypothetical protein